MLVVSKMKQQNLAVEDVYKVKTSDEAKYRAILKTSKSNQKHLSTINKKNFEPSYPVLIENIDTNELKEEIIKAYKSKRLYKGFEEVVSAICFDASLTKVYVVGNTDFIYETRFQNALTHKGQKTLEVKRIPAEQAQLVYEALKHQSSNDKVKRQIPRRHFFCRFIAIRE